MPTEKRKLKVLSASQYQRFECPRRGVLEYVYGFKQPPTDSLLLGTRVHAVAEGYLQTGIFNRGSEAGEIFEPAIPLIPKPGTCETERAITFETPNSPWRGAIDFLHRTGQWATIGDFKTTKHVKYKKSERELKQNVQANLYAYWAYQNEPKVYGSWVYLSTGPERGASVTHVDFDRSEVTDFIGKVDERAAYIQSLQADAPRAEDVGVDTTKCFEYGKTCHHRLEGRCIIKAQSQAFSERGTNMGESILDRIKRQKAAQAEQTSKVEATPPSEVTEEFNHPAEPPMGSMAYGEPESGFINAPEGSLAASIKEASDGLIRAGLESLAAEDKEHASEVDERAQLKQIAVNYGLCESNSRLRIDALRKLITEYESKPSERGKTERQNELRAEVNEPALSEPEPSMQNPFRSIGTLYIDCLPNDVVTDAHMVVSSFLQEVLDQLGEPHLKFVAYGKGTAALALRIQKHLNDANYSDMFADARTIDADVLAVLVRNAATVVRGLR